MNRRRAFLVLFLFVILRLVRGFRVAVSQRQPWHDFFLDGYLPNVLLSNIRLTGNGFF